MKHQTPTPSCLPPWRKALAAFCIALSAAAIALLAHPGSLFTQSAGRGRTSLSQEKPGYTDPGGALRFRRLQIEDENGFVPPDGLEKARQHVERMKIAHRERIAARRNATGESGIGTLAAGINPGSWTPLGPGNIGGRIRSIVIHPTDPARMWIGSVSGGIWRTTNGGASWQPVDDFQSNLAVTTLVIHPTNPDIMYAGTGEGFGNVDAIRGAGVFKSIDGGTTWNQLASTANDFWYFVNRLAISPDGTTLLAATSGLCCDASGTTLLRNGGIWRSTDAGVTWSQRTSIVAALDVDFVGGSSTRAVVGELGVSQFSTDGGQTWTPATFTPAITNGNTVATNGRVELATARIFNLRVYASVNNNSGAIYQSNDSGQNYTLVNTGTNYLDSQGWYDNTIWMNPGDPEFIIVGGIHLWRSFDGGTTLEQISDGQGNESNRLSPHADHHIIAAHPGFDNNTNRVVFSGNDGGIYRADNIATATINSGWAELNNELSITQFYGAAISNLSGVVIGGTQDNGTLRFSGASEGWIEMFGGDGGFAAADPDDVLYFYGETQNLRVIRSTDGGMTASFIDAGLTDANNCPTPTTCRANFIAPLVLDPVNPNTLLAGGLSLWRSPDVKEATPTWASIKVPTGSNSPISAIVVSPATSDLILVGHNNGAIFRTFNGTDAAPLWTQIDTGDLPDRMVTRLVIDRSRATNWYYAVFGGFTADNIYRSTDNGATWTDVTGVGATGLPDVPIRSLVLHPQRADFLYVGTEVGIFTSEDAGATWDPTQDAPANVSIDELFFRSDGILYAATHGRGLYRTTTVVSAPPLVTSLSDSGEGSFRQAIARANVLPAGDRRIKFEIPGAGVKTINVFTPLAPLDGITVDGWSQGGPDYRGVPLIELVGTGAPAGTSGLVSNGNSTIVGMAINRFSGSGIVLQNGGNNKVHACYIGTDATGIMAQANGGNGILIDNSPQNEIGSPNVPPNVISGNAVGVRISGSAATLNHFTNNRIGTNASGTARIPNLGDGVQIADAPGNFIGSGVGNLAVNVISGNGANNFGADGIEITGAGASGNKIYNNFIGLNASGTAALVNLGSGVRIQNAPDTEIGFANPNNRNIIAGSSNQGGIALLGSGSSGTIIRGNYLGTDVTGMVAINNNATNIYVESGNNIIGGTTPSARNVISGFHSSNARSGSGISLFFAGAGNVIQGNYIGTNAAGTAALSDLGVGIDIRDTNNVTLGGTSAAERNIISGNQEGIRIAIGAVGGPGNVRVQGNYIGTNPAGNAALPNRFAGIRVDNSMNNLIIGGTAPGAGNVIAADATLGGTGIRMSTSTGGVIQGNRIGTNAAGTVALGNGGSGIEIFNSTNTLVGGTAPGARNIISANRVSGINLSANGNTIQGNYIGTDVNGVADFGNGRTSGAAGINVSGNDNIIGGTAAGEGNIIAFNGCPTGCGNPTGTGLRVEFGSGNRIRGNSIFSNAEIGINLVGGSENSSRVTANDSCDADTGPNNLQNFPVITSAQTSGAVSTINGTLNSTANATFQVDFYSSPACDPSGNGEGKTHLGSTSVTTDGTCNVSFQAMLNLVLPQNSVVTATVTDAAGNTSEFSACRASVVPPAVPVSGALSRKAHGGAGTFGVDLPLDGAPGIESRSGGASLNHTVVFVFPNTLTSVGGAAVTSGGGTVASAAIGSDPHEYVVNLAGVVNAQRITVTLGNVADSAGNASSAISVVMAVLAGDTNGSGGVTSSDIAQTKSTSGQPLSGANFRTDVNAGGTINATDLAQVKAQAGTALP